MALKRPRSRGFLRDVEDRLARAREEEERLHRKAKRVKNEVLHHTRVVDDRTARERALIAQQMAEIERQQQRYLIEGRGPVGVWTDAQQPEPLPPPVGEPVLLDPQCPICWRRFKPSRLDYHMEKCRGAEPDHYIERYWRDFPGS